ncbi:MAG: ATPase [Chloroflexi bacterium]|nr:ATPase [Chloroflexota bacterium]
MDILHLVDRLEELFNESRSIPFTHNVIIDEDRMLDIIDQMRVSIPDEIKKAQQLIAQRDRMLAQAQEEANRTIMLAREKGKQIVDQDEIVLSAQKKADQIIEQARLDSDQTRQEADEYALQSLANLEIEMERALNQIRNGIQALRTTTITTPPTENG